MKKYFYFISITLLLGVLSALFTSNSMNVYKTITKPFLNPPSIVFPIVWSILYTLMGIGIAMIFSTNDISKKNDNNKKSALLIYFIQLLFNIIWPVLFFNFHLYFFSFIWIILLLILIVVMIVKFYQINKTAAFLQIPYLVWVIFASYLNLMIAILN
ncbi:MAG: tryptophan-rich sensory protein [Bacilli bacterium]|nr:tryptophan-rich sensory protein [Bacilli bacterium]